MLGRIVRFSGFIYGYSKYVQPYMLADGDSCGCTWHPFVGIGDENSLRTEGTQTMLFNARILSLCSHISDPAVNSTQRIGTACLVANSIHLFRTSESAFVLSGERNVSGTSIMLWLTGTYR